MSIPQNSEINDPASLQRSGRGAREIADATKPIGKHPVPETRRAASSLSGENWDGSLGSALRSLADLWEDQTSSLAGKMHGTAGALGETGSNYFTVESHNSKAMQEGLSDFN